MMVQFHQDGFYFWKLRNWTFIEGPWILLEQPAPFLYFIFFLFPNVINILKDKINYFINNQIRLGIPFYYLFFSSDLFPYPLAPFSSYPYKILDYKYLALLGLIPFIYYSLILKNKEKWVKLFFIVKAYLVLMPYLIIWYRTIKFPNRIYQ